MEDLGRKLREARLARGLSIRELARRAEVSASLISQVERDQANPSAASLLSIANALKMPIDYFFSDVSYNAVMGIQSDGLLTEKREPAPGQFGNGAEAQVGAGDRPSDANWPNANEGVPVVRLEERAVLNVGGGVEWRRLTPAHDHSLNFVEVNYDVGAASSEVLSRHEGREYGLVSQGQLKVELAFDSYILNPGDSISYDSMIPHRLVNVGDEPMVGIWIVVGQR